MNKTRNQILTLAAITAGMFGLAFASVPLYSLFCKVTGYGGTPKTATELPQKKGTKTFIIRFNADIDPNLEWNFAPEQKSITLVPGERKLIAYQAENRSDAPITGRAIYNVTPDQAGAYFSKIECFCFKEQTLKAHEIVHMPVSFFLDPAIENDPDPRGIDTITLSYTFLRPKSRD